MAKLLESDFLTVDLGSMFKNRTDAEANSQAAESESEINNNEHQITDWGKELENRLEANNKLSVEARESEYDIETKFFEEYFNANWKDPAVAKQLMLMGEPLKKAIKVLEFDKTINPILAFISNDYVIDVLIKTKLLNASTFKAIYNAVAQKLVAHSQFFTANDYNVIYYPGLYRKSASEMLEYLKLQNSILSSTANKYTKPALVLNKKVFLHLSEEKNFSKLLAEIKAKDVRVLVQLKDKNKLINIKLNDIALAKQLKVALSKSNTQKQSETNLTISSKKELVQEFNTPAKKLAAIQYIGLATDSARAKEALTSDIFNKVSGRDLSVATLAIADKIPKGMLSEKDADDLIELILGDM